MNPEQFLQQWTQGNTIQQPKSLTLWVDQRSWACQWYYKKYQGEQTLDDPIWRWKLNNNKDIVCNVIVTFE
jgi:hypothetical protein